MFYVGVRKSAREWNFLKNALTFSLFLSHFHPILNFSSYHSLLWYAHIFFGSRRSFFSDFLYKLVDRFCSLSLVMFNEISHTYIVCWSCCGHGNNWIHFNASHPLKDYSLKFIVLVRHGSSHQSYDGTPTHRIL